MKPGQIVWLVGLFIALPLVVMATIMVSREINERQKAAAVEEAANAAADAAMVGATKAQLNGLKNSIQMYQIRMHSLPETLEALRDGPSDATLKAKWVAPIITEAPTDAWENQHVYTVNGNTFEIRSGGVDGQINTDDDIVVTGP